MKTFKYRHTIAVYILSALIMVFTAVGCYFGIKSAIIADLIYQRIAYIMLSTIGLFLFTLALSVIISSKYYIKNKKLYIRFGIICGKISLTEILSLLHVIDQKKLIIGLKDDKFIYAVISPDDIELFVNAIKDENPLVLYDVCYSAIENKKND